jgi:glycosyltransferase involved in cell wall biosynthesis
VAHLAFERTAAAEAVRWIVPGLKVSIVVPAFNEERLLPAALRSISDAAATFTAAGWDYELIVCDNNSTDRTAEIAAAAGARVVFEPVNQIARARNAGAAVAAGAWLIFVDADSHPSAPLFADVVAAIRSGQCIGGGATIAIDSDRTLLRAFTAAWNLVSRTARWMAGSFIFCDASAFRGIGGFSQDLYAAEEIDFSRRLKRAGRAGRRRIVILNRHPLLTSARKAHLYSARDALRFYTRVVLTGGRSLRTAKGAFVWYDGRR